jgi:uncharacterized protein
MSAKDWKDMLEAAQEGDLELVRSYLEQEVNPDYQHPEYLTTPLIESIVHHHLDITRYLLEQGANPRLKAGFSMDTPLRMARRSGNRAAVELLKPHYPNWWQRLFAGRQ